MGLSKRPTRHGILCRSFSGDLGRGTLRGWISTFACVPVAKKADEVGFFGSGEFQHQRADRLSR